MVEKTFYATEDPDILEEIEEWITKNAHYDIEKGEALKIEIKLSVVTDY